MRKLARASAVTAVCVALSHPGILPAEEGAPEEAGYLLPMELIAWKEVPSETKHPKVVVLCLVDKYRPDEPTLGGPNDKTPAQMLDLYLRGLRSLGLAGQAPAAIAPVSSGDVKILIVECGKTTRDRAAYLHRRLKRKGYDRTIPVIYVFRSGRLGEVYTYRRRPGRGGHRLKRFVEQLLVPE